MPKKVVARSGVSAAGMSPPVLERLPELRSFGVSVFDPLWAEREHRDRHAELLYMVRGRMDLELAGQRHPLAAGDMAMVPPDTPHRDIFEHDEEPEIFMAQFSWAAGAAFFAEVTNEALAGLSEHERDDNARDVARLRDPELSASPWDRRFAQVLLHAWLMRVWRAVRIAGMAPGEGRYGALRRTRLMELARRHIDVHFAAELTLDKLAKSLGVSVFHLSRVFSRESGFSLISYLTAVRMAKARDRLLAGEGNVAEVAFAVGYENSAYFSRVFKRYYGVAPSAVVAPSPPRR